MNIASVHNIVRLVCVCANRHPHQDAAAVWSGLLQHSVFLQQKAFFFFFLIAVLEEFPLLLH